MSIVSRVERLRNFLPEFRPDVEPVPRGLALYSAAIALADEQVLAETALCVADLGANQSQIYEIVLQSYLFLGFPRMLTAAESFNVVFPSFVPKPVSEADALRVWNERGMNLCKQVYAGNFQKLREKVISFSPEIFDWMILEGYGKVLSRDNLDIRTRELAVVGCLMIDNRPKQLRSHIRGAINVGVEQSLLRSVIEDIGRLDKDGHRTAVELLGQIRTNV